MATDAGVVPHEQRLKQDWSFAMGEADRFFGEGLEVFETLNPIAQRLESLGIPYAVAGSVAVYAHSRWSMTPEIEIVVTREGLDVFIEDAAEGQETIRGKKVIKNGIPIDFLISGKFPGDGRPKPVTFPDPSGASVDLEGVKYLSVPRLIELKIASGMSAAGRLKDLAEVVELIRALDLPRSFRDQLHPYVQAKYDELWAGLQVSSHGPDEDVEIQS